MVDFLKKKAVIIEVDISVKAKCDEKQIDQLKEDIQFIVSNLNANEINILRKVAAKPLIKNAALAQAKKLV